MPPRCSEWVAGTEGTLACLAVSPFVRAPCGARPSVPTHNVRTPSGRAAVKEGPFPSLPKGLSLTAGSPTAGLMVSEDHAARTTKPCLVPEWQSMVAALHPLQTAGSLIYSLRKQLVLCRAGTHLQSDSSRRWSAMNARRRSADGPVPVCRAAACSRMRRAPARSPRRRSPSARWA